MQKFDVLFEYVGRRFHRLPQSHHLGITGTLGGQAVAGEGLDEGHMVKFAEAHSHNLVIGAVEEMQTG